MHACNPHTSMPKVKVEVQPDHLQSLYGTCAAAQALPELIWNSLDAEASKVKVRFHRNGLQAVEAIFVEDNGRGIPHDQAEHAFKSLGDSWKRHSGGTTDSGRSLHGRWGKGRFRAFALGDSVRWITRYHADDGLIYEYQIEGRASEPGVFDIEDAPRVCAKPTGTEVFIDNIREELTSPTTATVRRLITESFALYLGKYPNVSIEYDLSPLDLSEIQGVSADYNLEPVTMDDGRAFPAALSVIEWKVAKTRTLSLCDAGGFALLEIPAGIHAPGFQFTAYLKSDAFREYHEQRLLDLDGLNPKVREPIEAAKSQLRTHFRERRAESAANLVEEWKQADIYPYTGRPQNIVDEVERQVFDVVALNVHAYLPSFDEADPKSKKLSFRLLRQALETSPQAVSDILRNVLELPPEKQADLAKLLQKTTLAAIINAAKVVADRLDFLKGIQLLVFEHKEDVLERKQLHRILAEQTWIFGEQFNLTVDDKGLTEVLRKHLSAVRGKEVHFHIDPVRRTDGSRGIVDLVLSRSVPQPRPEKREHLVVELKRPSQNIDMAIYTQLYSYAMAVRADERFRDTDTSWVFWAIADDWSPEVRAMATEQEGPSGRVFSAKDGKLSVWVKTWGQIIQECEGRLRFFEQHLGYSADQDSALAYLRAVHAKYLPPEMVGDPETKEETP